MSQVQGGGSVPEGTRLNDMYEVGTRIAMGGMGEVYTGKQIETDRKVALKMILPEHANNELILELFRKEANTLHDVYHEAIVRYFAFSVDPTLNRPYMAMEFAGGPALGERLADKGPLNEAEMTILRQRIAGGLHAAHKKGVVHRDISSDNIILVEDKVEEAKIIDFGIAKSSSSEGTLIGSGFAGKVNYVSPEQLGLADGEVSAKSDIYSLGLVFAEAAIGKPLPMGGSHVEVTEKRKTVPDLSEVPLFMRPLIEWMLQPDPANRPTDLEAVADWELDGGDKTIVVPAAGAVAGMHPRDRLKQAKQAGTSEKKAGTPWGLIVLGGGGIAAAAVAALVLLGGEQTPDTGGGDAGGTLIQGEDPQTSAVGTLAGPAQEATAPVAVIGQRFDWTTPAFTYGGDASALSITPRGSLPPGLIFQASNDGTARIYGVPTADGIYSIGIVAISPEEERAQMSVQLTVDPAPVVAEAPETPVLESTLSTPQIGGTEDAGVTSGTADNDVPATQPSGIAVGTVPTGDALASVPREPEEEPIVPSTGVGGAQTEAVLDESSEPSVNTAATALLQPGVTPSPAGSGVNTGDASDGGLRIPSTGVGQSVSSAPSIGSAPSVGGSPATLQPETPVSSSQPTLSTGLLAPQPSDDSNTASVSTGSGSDGGLTLPSTGVGAGSGLTVPAPTSSGSTSGVAALPTNSPPTIVSSLTEPLGAARNVPLDSIIGTFFDEDGPEKLRLQIDGFLPAGVSARLTSEGRVQLTGTPREYGSFPLQIAAVDPEGAVSDAFVFTLNILETKDNLKAWKYISNYPGGDCTLSRPDVLTETTAIVEVFAAESAIDRIYQLNDDFIRDMGFEADFNVRLIAAAQCPLIHAMDQVGPAALDNALVIELSRDELTTSDRLVGKVQGGDGAKLYLYDSQGGLHDLSADLKTVAGETGFDIEMSGTGAQILIAAKPRPGSNIDPSQGIDYMLGAARRGEASLALGYFTME